MSALSLYSRLAIFALLGCTSVSCVLAPSHEAPTNAANDPQETPDTSNFAVFNDPDSEFSTMDVRDVDEQIVRFDTLAKTLVWVADGSSFDNWQVNDNLLGQDTPGAFQVRFGMMNGVQQAYFTETVPATICDIEVVDGELFISATQMTVPQ